MQCPIDQTELVMTERQGVEIDYCPKCRGVWLDRGELDKIIERANAFESSSDAGASTGRESFTTPRVGNMQGRVQPLDSNRRRDNDDDDDDYNWDQRKHKKSKRRNFFEEIFDFD